MIKRILVGISGQDTADCKQQIVVDMASRHKAMVEILSIVDSGRLSHIGPVPVGCGHVADHIRGERIKRCHDVVDQATNRFKTACTDADLESRVINVEGDPFEILSCEWRSNDITVLGLRDWFDHGFVDEPEDTLVSLVTKGVQPILAVGPEFRPIHKVLVAYDGSKEAARAMKTFCQLRLWPDALMHIACFGHSSSEAAAILDPADAYCRAHGHETQIASVDGRAKHRLLDYAQEIDADLVIMGCNYHRVLLHNVVSETTVRVLRNSDRPIFMSH